MKLISSISRLPFALMLLAGFLCLQFAVGQEQNDSENPVQNLKNTANNDLSDDRVDQIVEAIEALPFSSQPLYRAQGVLNFRAEIGPQSRILDQIPDGFAALHIVDQQGTRALVRYCGNEGWVSINFLRKQNATEPRKQSCRRGLYDPFPVAIKLDEIEDINIDDTLIIGDNQRIDATEVERDLGQAVLSPAYDLCLRDANNQVFKQSQCLIEEQKNWKQDMDIAFDLVAATLPFSQMKLLRDSQRIWAERQDDLCDDLGLADAAPFTRFHVPTCRLKMTFQRAIDLENLLQDESLQDPDAFEQKLFELDIPLAPE